MKIIMKTMFGTLMVLLICVFAACGGDPLGPGRPEDFEINPIRIELSLNEWASVPGETLQLEYTIPNYTTRGDVEWVSSDEDVAAVTGGLVTAIGEGNCVITVCSVQDPSVKARCAIAIYPEYGSNRTWNFQTVPEGWTDGTAASAHPDTDYGDGMILTSSTGSGEHGSGGGVRNMGIFTTVGPDETPGFSVGYLHVSGMGRACKIAAVQGPFTITVNYMTNTNNQGRFASIVTGEWNTDDETKYTIVEGEPSSVRGTGAQGGKSVTWTYSETNMVPYVYVDVSDSLRIYDIIITEDAS
jgi:hypothetical protein